MNSPPVSECQSKLPKRIAIFLYNGVEPMDFQGPCGMFDLWRLEAGGPEVVLVGPNSVGVTCAYGREHRVDYDLENCPEFDVLIVPGGRGWRQLLSDERAIGFLSGRGSSCTHLLSVCTGAFLLAGAGLLEGKRVTTHWELVHELAQHRGLQVTGEERVVHDGRVWSAAGIYSGIDLALSFIDSVTRDAPKDALQAHAAGKVQLYAQYFPETTRYAPGPVLSSAPDFVQRAFHTHSQS